MPTKNEAIEAALSNLDKKFGKGTAFKFSDMPNTDIETISTSIKSLDKILGGGIPKGRIIELYGFYSSGKSSLSYTIMSQVQKAGGLVAYIDTEHALDSEFASKLGVNIGDIYYSQPNSSEEAYTVLEELLKTKGFDLIVFDSVAATAPLAELNEDIGKSTIALNARLLSQVLRRLTPIISNTNTAVIFINQVRQNISVTGYGGSGYVTPGGEALKFHASTRIELKKGEYIKKGEDTIGHKIKIKTVKNKLAAPFQSIMVDFYFDSGFSTEGALIETAIDLGVVIKTGAWISFEDIKVQGLENFKELLKKQPDVYKKIEDSVDTLVNKKS